MSDAKQYKIAFLGLGLMGSRMATRLLNAGYSVQLWNRSAQKADALVALGGVRCETPADAAQGADVIITILSDKSAVDRVLFDADGVASACKPGALVVDMSSLHPDFAKEHKNKLSTLDVRYLDAPVSGGVSGAESGTLSIMVGGDELDLDRVKPILDVMGTPFHLGGTGAGQICKLVNQAIVHVTIGAVSEGLLFASALGVDASKVREAIGGGYCQSRILDVLGSKMIDRDFVPGGQAAFGLKDLRSVVQLAEQNEVQLPLTDNVTEQYEKFVGSGRGNYDHSALLLALEELSPPHRVSPDKQDVLPE